LDPQFERRQDETPAARVVIDNLIVQAVTALVGLTIGAFACDTGIVVFRIIVGWVLN
jgi:hypothetical protein